MVPMETTHFGLRGERQQDKAMELLLATTAVRNRFWLSYFPTNVGPNVETAAIISFEWILLWME